MLLGVDALFECSLNSSDEKYVISNLQMRTSKWRENDLSSESRI